MAGFIAASAIRFGKQDGSVVAVRPGDTVDKKLFDDEQWTALVEAGSVEDESTAAARAQADEDQANRAAGLEAAIEAKDSEIAELRLALEAAKKGK